MNEVADEISVEPQERESVEAVSDEGLDTTVVRVQAILTVGEVVESSNEIIKLAMECAEKINTLINRSVSNIIWKAEEAKVTKRGNLMIPLQVLTEVSNRADCSRIYAVLKALHVNKRTNPVPNLIISEENIVKLLDGTFEI